MQPYLTPILFIIFNRPHTALRSFEEIKKAKPRHLYIASDAHRKQYPEEALIVEETRNLILNAINWDCEVQTLFQEENLGCGLGVYTAINWFFQNVEFGIILEDDCVVDTSFFPFMNEMLLKYKTDERIGMIAGTNPINLSNYNYSYIFSKYKSCWGWGTWHRAWKNMDIDMRWRKDTYYSVLRNSGYDGKDISGWKYKLRCIDKGIVSAWDWQWYFSLAAQNQLCIYPKVNLVSNIGDDANATHTALGNITLKSSPLHFPLGHPKYILPNSSFDKAFYKSSNTLQIRLLRIIPHRIKKMIKKAILNIKK